MPAHARSVTERRLFAEVPEEVERLQSRSSSWEERVPVRITDASPTVQGEPATDCRD
jgi:hypothetical protein